MKTAITALFPTLDGDMVHASELTARDVLALPSEQRPALEYALRMMILERRAFPLLKVERLRVINVDRMFNHSMGGMPSDHDRAIVVDESEREPHPISGEWQPKRVFSGTLKEAHAWVTERRAQRSAVEVTL